MNFQSCVMMVPARGCFGRCAVAQPRARAKGAPGPAGSQLAAAKAHQLKIQPRECSVMHQVIRC